jgi:hypothetical protein
MWRHNGKVFPFFSLPPKVRQMMYRELFLAEEVLLKRAWPGTKRREGQKARFLLFSRALGFLFSCRQAHEEARLFFTVKTVFPFRIGTSMWYQAF